MSGFRRQTQYLQQIRQQMSFFCIHSGGAKYPRTASSAWVARSLTIAAWRWGGQPLGGGKFVTMETTSKSPAINY